MCEWADTSQAVIPMAPVKAERVPVRGAPRAHRDQGHLRRVHVDAVHVVVGRDRYFTTPNTIQTWWKSIGGADSVASPEPSTTPPNAVACLHPPARPWPRVLTAAHQSPGCTSPNHQNTPTVPGRVPTTPAGPNYCTRNAADGSSTAEIHSTLLEGSSADWRGIGSERGRHAGGKGGGRACV